VNLFRSSLAAAAATTCLTLFAPSTAGGADTPATMTVIHCPRLFDSLDGKMLGRAQEKSLVPVRGNGDPATGRSWPTHGESFQRDSPASPRRSCCREHC
jgi:hypothetical protein